MNFKALESPRKLGGTYYTPPTLAAFLAQWVMDGRPRHILEPSSGDGVFIDAINTIAESGNGAASIHVEGIDVDAGACSSLTKKVRAGEFSRIECLIRNVDFLEFSLRQMTAGAEFDAVIGNPPFIRYQYLEKAFQQLTEKIFFSADLPFTRHTNAWVPFVIQGLRLLRPGGRLGMVIPAEIMHVLHAQSVRQFILRTCDRVSVIDVRDLFSSEVLQGIVLLLCEKKETRSARPGRIAFPRAHLDDLRNGHAIEFTKGVQLSTSAGLDHKWMLGLLTDEERSVLEKSRTTLKIQKFNDIADVDVGIVTGANKFFLVDDDTVKRYELHSFVKPMFGRSSHVAGVIVQNSDVLANATLGLPTNFLHFPSVSKNVLPKGVCRYIEFGEAQNLHTRYKCRVRTPWYSVPSVWAAEIALLKRAHSLPRLIRNRAGAFTTDTAYRIVIKSSSSGNADDLVACFVNSLTALSAEVEGRHYGGGVIELVPSEIERLITPILIGAGKQFLDDLDRFYRDRTSVEEIVDVQDRRVLRPLGYSEKEIKVINSAWRRLMGRRQRGPFGAEVTARI